MIKLQGGTIFTIKLWVAKAIRPLFADPVTNIAEETKDMSVKQVSSYVKPLWSMSNLLKKVFRHNGNGTL